jgi:hypothetical protein
MPSLIDLYTVEYLSEQASKLSNSEGTTRENHVRSIEEQRRKFRECRG